VTARDTYGNTATGYTGTVTFTSSDVGASTVLPTNYPFVPGDNGTHSFSATLTTAGTQSLTAKDTVTSTITGSQNGIVVNPAAAKTLTVAGFPSPQTAGVAGTFTVTAKDAFNNTATGYTGTVTFTSSDVGASTMLPANYPFVPGDNGTHSFSATLTTAGTQSLTAKDTVTSTITGSQTGIVVNPAAAKTLTVAGFPSPRTAGVAGSVTVTAKDQYDNTATGYTGKVHFTGNDPNVSIVLPPDYTFLAGDNGAHTFTNGVTLKTAGSRTVTATDMATASITGTQSGITINPAGASTLTVAGFPNPQTAGTAGSVTMTAKDQYDNTATGYTGKVHFTSNDPNVSVVLPPDYTFLAGDNGAHTFNNGVTLKTAGSRTVTATDMATASITGAQSGITINPAGATALTVTGLANVAAGTPQTVIVTAKDQYNNTATGYTGKVHFTSNDPNVTTVLPPDYTFLAGDNGAHTFTNGVTLRTAGSRTVTATDTVTATITGFQTVTVL
jgi:pyruvoyl-dependent arginine decarboxylase (PvlArgDC)